MSTRLTLDIDAMQDDFFSDAALIGIVSALPAYRLSWLLNLKFELAFTRDLQQDICVQSDRNIQNYYTVYQYNTPLNGPKYILYKIRANKQSLLPELKGLDYLWMIKSSTPALHATEKTNLLRKMPEIQLAQVIDTHKLKNLDYLLF